MFFHLTLREEEEEILQEDLKEIKQIKGFSVGIFPEKKFLKEEKKSNVK